MVLGILLLVLVVFLGYITFKSVRENGWAETKAAWGALLLGVAAAVAAWWSTINPF